MNRRKSMKFEAFNIRSSTPEELKI